MICLLTHTQWMQELPAGMMDFVILTFKEEVMKKFLLSVVAAVVLCFVAPQAADAKLHRFFVPLDNGFYAQMAIDDRTGDVYIMVYDVDTWEGEMLMSGSRLTL